MNTNTSTRITLTAEVLSNIDRICQTPQKRQKKSWHSCTNKCWYWIKKYSWRNQLVLGRDGLKLIGVDEDAFIRRGWAIEAFVPSYATMTEVKTRLDEAWKEADRLEYEHDTGCTHPSRTHPSRTH